MRKLILACFAICVSLPSFAQQDALAKEILKQVNAARTSPANFLKANREAISENEPKYILLLEKAKALPAITWETGLETMAKANVESNQLSPKYKGSLDLCGYAGGQSSGSLEADAISYICSFYTNVHDPDYRYLGLYFNKAHSKYAFYWGISCEKTLVPFSYDGMVDSSGVDFGRLNTGKNESYLTAVEKRMIFEINFVRAYPKVYAQIIARYLDDESKEDGGLANDTYEAGVELINELNAMKPAPILKPLRGVYDAAKAHGLDCKQRGFIAHEGSNGSDPWDRILKFCPQLETGNENLAGNAAENPRVPVIELLLDDGISSRGHRYNMLDPTWEFVGVYRYAEKPSQYYTMYNWVQNFGK